MIIRLCYVACFVVMALTSHSVIAEEGTSSKLTFVDVIGPIIRLCDFKRVIVLVEVKKTWSEA